MSPLTQDSRWRCMSLREPRLLGDEMNVRRGEARGETPLSTASQMQRGSASLQSTPTEQWNLHSWPDGAGATPDTLSIPPHAYTHILIVQRSRTNAHQGSQDSGPQKWNIRSPLHDLLDTSLPDEAFEDKSIFHWFTERTCVHTVHQLPKCLTISTLESKHQVFGVLIHESDFNIASSPVCIFLWATDWMVIKPWRSCPKPRKTSNIWLIGSDFICHYFVQFSIMWSQASPHFLSPTNLGLTLFLSAIDTAAQQISTSSWFFSPFIKSNSERRSSASVASLCLEWGTALVLGFLSCHLPLMSTSSLHVFQKKIGQTWPDLLHCTSGFQVPTHI